MTDLYSQAQAAAEYIRKQTPLKPTVGIILGSGLGDFAAQVEDPTSIPYADIPNFPVSTVVGHSGRLVLGTIAGVSVAVMQGRVHAYEGYTPEEVTFPIRVLGRLGARALLALLGQDNRGCVEGSLHVIAPPVGVPGTVPGFR